MIKFIALLALAFTSAAALDAGSMQQLFSQWMLLNNKFYADQDMYNYRLGVFTHNYDIIAAFNANPYKTSDVTLNQFADLTDEEFAALYLGVVGEKGESNTVPVERLTDAPEELDWEQKGAVNAVKNQAACGSCWAFSAIGAVEGLDAITNGKLRRLSEQQVNDCDPRSHGCRGGWMHWAFEYLIKAGSMLESDYPYTARDGTCKYDASKVVFRFNNYKNITQRDHVALRDATVNQPVSIAMSASGAAFRFYRSGVITQGCSTMLNHGIVVVGYGKENGVEHFRVRNSWGATWGNKGYALIERSARNVCAILELPSVPTMN